MDRVDVVLYVEERLCELNAPQAGPLNNCAVA